MRCFSITVEIFDEDIFSPVDMVYMDILILVHNRSYFLIRTQNGHVCILTSSVIYAASSTQNTDKQTSG